VFLKLFFGFQRLSEFFRVFKALSVFRDFGDFFEVLGFKGDFVLFCFVLF
jgi:hypothetical protein